MKQGKAKKIILFIIILLLIILGGCGYAYFATDIFKTPEELFVKYLANNVEQLKDFNLKPFDEAIKKMDTVPTDINVDIDFSADELETDVNANLNLKLDTVNTKDAFSMEVKQGEKSFFAFDTVITKDAFGLYMKELHDKYITIENRDLKKLAKTLDLDEETIEQIPDKIPEMQKLSDEDKQILENLKDRYCKRLLDQIDTSYYAVEKDVSVNVNGTDTKANKYTLTMGSKEFTTIIFNTLNELMEDPDFTGLYDDTTQIEEVKEQIEKLIEQLEEIDEDTDITIAVYEANKKTIKTEFIVEEVKAEFIISNNSIIMNMEDDYDNISYIISNSFEGTQGELTIEYIDNDYEDDNVKIVVKSTQNNDDIKSTIKLDGEQFEIDGLKYNISFSMKFNPNLKVTDLTNSNSLVINDYTQEEFTTLLTEIMENITKSAEEEPESLFGIIFSNATNTVNALTNTDFTNLDSNTSNLPNSTNNSFITDDFMSTDERFGEPGSKRDDVETEIKNALEYKLFEYRLDSATDENVNPADYLTIDNIQEECSRDYELELIDGNTIKCTVDDEVYYAKIDIDGDEWRLNDIEVLYSEDGTLENAR